jgi:hypothetical protein
MLERACAQVEQSKESSSFLKKRTKKLLSVTPKPDWPIRPIRWTQQAKVFCFFFSRKKTFLSRSLINS